jgi:preprotein translocase subunit SecE
MTLFTKIQIYLQETKIELKKVSWPTKKEVVKYVTGVVVFSGIVALILGLFDFAFLEAVSKLLLR